MGNLKATKAKEKVLQLNEMFQSHEVAPEEFYDQLKFKGIDVTSSILINFCPDGDNTYFGSIINQAGEICSFDIDCNDEKFTRWDSIKLEESLRWKNSSQFKPWDAEVIAISIFNEKSK